MVRKDLVFGTVIFLFATVAYFSSKESLEKNDIINKIKNENDSLNNIITNQTVINDSIKKSIKKKTLDRFVLVKERFIMYNKNIHNNTIKKFIEVVDNFNLDESDKLFEVCISQICVESGAKQRTIDGKVIKSTGNAIGITQIVPTTAHHYLRNLLTKEDIIKFNELGATDFSFVKSHPRYSMSKTQRDEIKNWLSNETNNIVLWGYIMKTNLKRTHNNIPNTLVAYNQGNGYLDKYLSNGNSPKNHIYVKLIEDSIKKLRAINDLLA